MESEPGSNYWEWATAEQNERESTAGTGLSMQSQPRLIKRRGGRDRFRPRAEGNLLLSREENHIVGGRRLIAVVQVLWGNEVSLP